MKRTFRYRLYPSRVTEQEMLGTIEVCRRTYNTLRDIRIANYDYHGKGLSKFDMNKSINHMGINIGDVHSQVLQNVSDRLDRAFRNFFRRIREKQKGSKVKVGYPRFKKKGSVKSFTYPQNGYKIEGNKLSLSKIGMVNLKIGRTQNMITGKIKTLTIKHMPSGKWFAMFSCIIDEEPTKTKNIKDVGIDVGLETYASLSDGTEIENPRYKVSVERRLKKLDRTMSKRKLRSKRREKARVVRARANELVVNRRHCFLHQTTKMLIDKYGRIAIEDLNIRGMVRHPYLAKHINDASWGSFFRILEYKAASAGVRVEKVNPRGTTIECSQCGIKVPKSLAQRFHICPNCGLRTGRDLNAAINILNRATVGTTESYARGDRSSPLIVEGSLSEKREAPQLVGE